MASILWAVYLVAAVTVDCRYLHGHHSQNTTLEEPAKDIDIEAVYPMYLVDDMELNEEQWAALRQRKAIDGAKYRWDGGRVPYVFKSNTVDKSAVMDGIKHWEDHTCIAFDPLINNNMQINEPHLQFITKGDSICKSSVGKQDKKTGKLHGQTITISKDCRELNTVVHEIGHAIGFHHEHQRKKRNMYIQIVDGNIDFTKTTPADKKVNFDLLMQYKDFGVPYDLTSIMHYKENYFALPDKLTIIAIDPLNQELVGKGNGLSYRDKLLANEMYSCTVKWLALCGMKGKDPCLPDGYTGKNCDCVCSPEAISTKTATGSICKKNGHDYYANMRSRHTEKITKPTQIKIDSSITGRTEFVKWIVPPKCQMANVKFTFYDMWTSTNDCEHQYLNIRKKSNDLDGERLCPGDLKKLPTIRPMVPDTDIIIRMYSNINYRDPIHPILEAEVTFHEIPDCTTTSPTVNWCSNIFEFGSDWTDTWSNTRTVEGMLKITFPNTVSSWNLYLTFNQDITDFIIWDMESVLTSARTVTLTPKHWNTNQLANSVLSASFQFKFAGSNNAKLISTKLDGDELC